MKIVETYRRFVRYRELVRELCAYSDSELTDLGHRQSRYRAGRLRGGPLRPRPVSPALRGRAWPGAHQA
jgi:hypothetical protein